MELTVQGLPATLTLPEGPVRAGLIPLHGASNPERDHWLYRHLAEVLPQHGIAVLRYDRRPSASDVPFADQAADAIAAVEALREYTGDVPIGLWGYSQGAWVAPLAAATAPEWVAFVITVSACGVSPGEQMRYGLAEQLRAAGHASALGELTTVQDALYAFLRGESDAAAYNAAVAPFAERPWWGLTGYHSELPADLQATGLWTDLDYDPEPAFAGVRCPVLAFYGESDAWVPIEHSLNVWNNAAVHSPEVVRLEGCDHKPATDPDGPPAREYEDALVEWLAWRVTGRNR
ncbi:hypothetical protein Afil01_24230 [Actinorhabdospora filicis]|uniref:AB hydrolase-1 domain-containing protein n=1 Tax=Actinorhabdospora filicis TaxID=1785913 RepID=A0A9W6W9K1_9ACTN|nr:alpha/beta hydrolase [Actinorhabdospora filicis]GLZ77616.1 hypothetical protein Afil01_24230 [Actinorhabdospora filicis]